MKGLLDTRGQLYIERAGVMIPQICKKNGEAFLLTAIIPASYLRLDQSH